MLFYFFYVVCSAQMSSYHEHSGNPFYDRKWSLILKPAIYITWRRYSYRKDSADTILVWTSMCAQMAKEQRQTHSV